MYIGVFRKLEHFRIKFQRTSAVRGLEGTILQNYLENTNNSTLNL